MKKFFIILFSCFLSAVLLCGCNTLSPYSQQAQPITTNTSLIYESDGATMNNTVSNPSQTGSVSTSNSNE